MFCARLPSRLFGCEPDNIRQGAGHPPVILAARSPSVTITFRREQLRGQAVPDGRLAIMSPPDGAVKLRAAAGTRLSAEPRWPVLAYRTCAGGGGTGPSARACRYRTSPRASIAHRAGMAQAGATGSDDRPSRAQRLVPGQVPSGRPPLLLISAALGARSAARPGVPGPCQRWCLPVSAGQNQRAVASPPGLAHL